MSPDDCPICSVLGYQHWEDLRGAGPVSAPVQELIGEPPYPHGQGEATCPTCGTVYTYLYECGFGEHDVMLTRFDPPQTPDSKP